MKTLSVCVIVKNEERNLKECLSSVKNVADEIILVDNGSNDNTIKIAESFNCKVFDGSAYQLDKCREIYLKEATCDWILVIDADERLEELENGAVKKYINELDETVWGSEVFSFQHLGNGKWSEIFVLRLIRNNKKISYNSSSIHASMSSSILSQGGKIAYADSFVLHHLDILIPGRLELKRKRYRELLEECIKNYKIYNIDKDLLGLYKCFLGLEYVAVGAYERAEEIYMNVKNESFRYQGFAIQCLCQLYIYTNCYEKLEEYMIPKYLEKMSDKDVYGNYLVKKDLNEAITYYDTILHSGHATPSTYLNLAYLIKDTNPNEAQKMITELMEKYSFLKNKFLFNNGYKPNLFDVQSNILLVVQNLEDFMKRFNIELM